MRWLKKGRQIFPGKIGRHPSVAAPSDIKPYSDATELNVLIVSSGIGWAQAAWEIDYRSLFTAVGRAVLE